VRFPKTTGAALEGILLNTAGGLTGGDSMDISVELAPGARAMMTTASAEKIYRASDGETSIRCALNVGGGARLAWLPQPTILFDGSRLDRRTEVTMTADATFLAVETLIFGRKAMGEEVVYGSCRDAWRVRRGGVLVYADTFDLNGAVADALDRPAVLDGHRALATGIYSASDASARLEDVRELLRDAGSSAGASTWNGLLIVRATAVDGRTLLRTLAPLLEHLSGHPLPRVWYC
jgi:urease accessory protein